MFLFFLFVCLFRCHHRYENNFLGGKKLYEHTAVLHQPPLHPLWGLFSAAKPVAGKRDYPQTIDTLAFIQDMHEKRP